MEQVRERYEREHKASLDDDPNAGTSGSEEAPAFPWGQMVHDILSGREPTPPVASNPMESDLIEKIRQHRKHWLRDLEELEERIREASRDVETIHVDPEPSDVSIDRRLIVWARSLESFPPVA